MALKINYWNCGSGLLKKLDLVKEMIDENKIDIFFIAEAEVRLEFDLGCLSHDGYNLFTSNTLQSRGKSRIICLARKEFKKFELGSEFNDLIAIDCEGMNVVGYYRGFKCFDGETERSNLWRLLDAFSDLDFNKDTYIIGDMNVDLSETKSRFYDELHEWCDMKSLTISSVGVTRSRWVVDKLQESSLDILISNSSKFTLGKEHNIFSDHYIIKLECQNYIRTQKGKSFITVTNWNFDYLEARNYLSSLLNELPIVTYNTV